MQDAVNYMTLSSFAIYPESGLNRVKLLFLNLFAWRSKDHLAFKLPGAGDIPSLCDLVINQWVVVL